MLNLSQPVCQHKLCSYPINRNLFRFHTISHSQMSKTSVFGTVTRNWICRQQIGALIVSPQCWHVHTQTQISAQLLQPQELIGSRFHRNSLCFRCVPSDQSLSFLSLERAVPIHHEHIARHTLQSEAIGKVSVRIRLCHIVTLGG